MTDVPLSYPTLSLGTRRPYKSRQPQKKYGIEYIQENKYQRTYITNLALSQPHTLPKKFANSIQLLKSLGKLAGVVRKVLMVDVKIELQETFSETLERIKTANLTPEEKDEILDDLAAEIELYRAEFQKVAKKEPTKVLLHLALPKPDDGTYLRYPEYVQKCRNEGKKPKDRLTGEDFIKKYKHEGLDATWQDYIDAGLLYMPQLRKLDESLVNRLYYEEKTTGKLAKKIVPDISTKIDRELKNIDYEAIRRAENMRQNAKKRPWFGL